MCPNCESKMSLKKIMTLLGVLILGIWGFDAYASDAPRKALKAQTKKSVVSMLEINEKLHRSFFNYKAKEVEANAQKLSQAIMEIKDQEIAKLLSFSQKQLQEIKASKDRAANDQHYHLVSMALIHIVNTYDVGSKYNAYSCPMVKKKWLQNSKKMADVHNPYAPNMPHCGSQDSHY